MTAKNNAARAQERIQNVMDQLSAYENGEQSSLTCPYCAGINREGDPLCCSLFAKASIAALERLRVEQSTEVVRKVTERHLVN